MVSIRNYFTIFILMLMVFVMFMFVGVSSNILSDTAANSQAQDRIDVEAKDTITADSLNLAAAAPGASGNGRKAFLPEKKQRVAILSEGRKSGVSQFLVEWCVYNKYLYRIYGSLPDGEEIRDYAVVLFGDYTVTAMDLGVLYTYASLGKTMIFTRLPDYREIASNRGLGEFFGIRAGVAETVTADGIKVFSDFMISKERIYTKGDYFGNEDDTQVSVPYYSLAPGYEVYAVGMLDNQEALGIENKDLPPLLWRTTRGESSICVINSGLFDGMSLLGVLTGFMSHLGDYYVYPVVNAQTISLVDYPYFSDENGETLQQLYSRTSEAVARDLLWPNIIQILKNYGGSYSFFAASQLDYLDGVGAKKDYIGFYLREIHKLPGNMGLSLGQVSDISLEDKVSEDEAFFKEYLPDYDFSALYTADFTAGELRGSLKSGLLEHISLVMSDYREGDRLLDFLEEDILSVKFNLDGYKHETRDDLRMGSIENALGMCNMKVDIGRVFYPEGDHDEWNYLSLEWSKGDTYFKDYSMLDMVPVYEMEKRARRFLALDYVCEYGQNEVSIRIDHFDEEAYFILCTNNRSIDSIENGTAKPVSATKYLIKATDGEVRIHMIEENVLGKPKNGKTIPGTPQ
ncbi:MAG TPA: DUF2194 domain-containing protein [Clostridiales bacterium]|nr:DUF2194 domain-containing protein [Clostridiales bacterium]